MNTFQSSLASPRKQRLLFWVGLVVLVAGIVVLMTKLVGGSDHTSLSPDKGFKPELPAKQIPLKDANGTAVTTYRQLDPVIRNTIKRFVLGAVAQQNYADSWNVIAPVFKRGYTAKTWVTSNSHPIVPFPVSHYDRSTFTVAFATTKEIMVSIRVAAKPGSGQHDTRFYVGLIKPHTNGQWLVNYWGPLWTPLVPYGGNG